MMQEDYTEKRPESSSSYYHQQRNQNSNFKETNNFNSYPYQQPQTSSYQQQQHSSNNQNSVYNPYESYNKIKSSKLRNNEQNNYNQTQSTISNSFNPPQVQSSNFNPQGSINRRYISSNSANLQQPTVVISIEIMLPRSMPNHLRKMSKYQTCIILSKLGKQRVISVLWNKKLLEVQTSTDAGLVVIPTTVMLNMGSFDATAVKDKFGISMV